ncbi:Rne/Rng family ribonuclease [Orenia marismortui]|uniref:Ribonuclease G n=1 Tax=Orenia marismortui TaxID=46469 RepID=A0A4R8GSQ0_9FIRM|nr:Rne/Rng family ribonuclease [Orenia marismortui]TDX49003.1 ribonuclease G [Orenia marismortui]
MNKEIVVNSRGLESRIAILENRSLVEIIYERDFNQHLVGNIYKGRVENVLPGMQAAFVDVGLEKNVFIHAKDLVSIVEKDNFRIEEVLNPGQELMVQITKEALGTKGPRGTCKLNLAGRYLVLLNSKGHIGVSRRIDDGEERGRLRKIAKSILPEDKGVIVRTVAAYKSEDDLERDLSFLLNLWKQIEEESKLHNAPCLVYKDLDSLKQVIRDKFTPKVDKLIIDTKDKYHQAVKLIENISPKLNTRVYYYSHPKPIFDYYNIEEEIKGLLERKVALNCGGYIIIDNTEALTAIDVNTGSYVGRSDLESTVVKTNLEAAREIAKQLRLRDIGGIIIVDFIDMNLNKDQELVLEVLRKELSKDKTKTNILGLTKLGLVEITRKNERERVGDFLQQECPYCQGRGNILSEESIFLDTVRKIKEVLWKKNVEALLLEAHPSIAARLIGSSGKSLKNLEEELNKSIYIKGNKSLHLEEVNFLKMGSKEKIKKMAIPLVEGEKLVLEVEERHINNSADGIARLDGYIIDLLDAGSLVGEKVKVEIIEVNKTYAQGKVIEVI